MTAIPQTPREERHWLEQRAQVRGLFFSKWDPIGVRGLAPADEHNAFADQALAMARNGSSETEIVDFLQWVRETHMGLGPSPDTEPERRIVGEIKKILNGD